MAIRLYNSMTGQKEELHTLEPQKVRFYACGPTVYNLFHVGNARMFVVFDTVRRYLTYRGYEVKFVQNFTDVDDRIINRANELGKDVRAVADYYIDAYFEDADALNIMRANIHPRVTECVPEIIEFIQDLIAKGNAYEQSGNVYFNTSSFKDYGKLSHQSIDEMRAGFRIEVNEDKQDPTDFALWKSAKPNEEFWESPWGPGRPGWHIECSVMNRIHLGDQIDIHAGGRDLIFPHHENEIAQSEAHSGKEFARYWMHNGTLNINGEKMSKSLGNFIMTRDLLEIKPAHIVRMFLLSSQYRHPLNYTDESIEQIEKAYDRIAGAIRNLNHRIQVIENSPEFLKIDLMSGEDDERVEREIVAVRDQFMTAMDDDFNTAEGITAIFEAVRLANTYASLQNVTYRGLTAWKLVIEELMDVLGVQLVVETESSGDDAQIDALVEERTRARKERNFARSDEIRDQLTKMGIVIEDTAQGTRWYRA